MAPPVDPGVLMISDVPRLSDRVRDQLVFRDLTVEVGIDRHLRLPTQNLKRYLGNRLSHKDLIFHKLLLNGRFNRRRDARIADRTVARHDPRLTDGKKV
jgi:hypothetical protein